MSFVQWNCRSLNNKKIWLLQPPFSTANFWIFQETFLNTLTTTPAPAGLVGSKRARRIFGRARVELGVWVVKRSSHKGFLGEGKRLLFMADSDELISPAGSFKCLQKELQAELSK
ncbi:hypothetical protein AVEN_188201-1 [Araneus ventricosus]|uniref:Uncharacterized protein n=1 Tax=Araneus ventricosus TaxID=182803 RepID=A0A4Y2KBR9_ARAVE|nr:hypothetical protein AVEN_188201-1 [Araneus ventricosus]